ncbi:MAG TPA: hypothetical protein VGE98_01835, partial [Thermoanaerobaculia bacterium]
MVGERSRSSFGALLRLLLVGAGLVVAALVVTTFWTGAPPKVEVKPALPGIGRRTPIEVRVSDTGRVEKLTVQLVQGMDVKPLLEKELPTRPAWAFWKGATPASFTVDVGRDTVTGLRTGEAIVRATADRAGSFFRHPDPVVAEVRLPVRLAPPTLSVASSFHYVTQGGCEAVVYRVGAGAVKDGVQSGAWWFPGFPTGGDPQERFALFAVPYDMGDSTKVKLVAIDEVGNRAEASFLDKFTPKPVHTDTIQVNDAFLGRVVPEILSQSPEVQDRGSLLANYLEINGELRRKDAQALKDLAAKSAHRFLWNEPFLPMPNAKITAAFADRRTYIYNGKNIDQQDHLGFDMAS